MRGARCLCFIAIAISQGWLSHPAWAQASANTEVLPKSGLLLPSTIGIDTSPPALTEAPRLEQTGVSADRSPPSILLDARVKASAAAAQRLYGPLDGGWILRDQHDVTLFYLQIADPGPSRRGALSGAWRDVRQTDRIGNRGLIDEIITTDQGVSIQISAPGAAGLTIISLQPSAYSDWFGNLKQGEVTVPVSLRRQ